jgi:nucleotide-binding universal stress UspA family protein
MFRKIVFANKGSSAGDRALLYLEHLACLEKAEVVVVHAFEVPNRYVTTEAYENLRAGFQKASWDVVDDAVAELAKSEVQARGIVREGQAARTILEVASEESASLIVLGTRGPSSAAELLLGSVSTEVLRLARCPVLAVP